MRSNTRILGITLYRGCLSFMTRLQELKETLSSYPRLLIAFSGGLDSSFLTFVAKELPLEEVLAVTIFSPLFSKRDRERAKRTAHKLGVSHQSLEIETLSKEVVANGPRRCYYCKREMFTRLLSLAEERGMDRVIHGANADDAKDYRPGEEAAEELGIEAPLKEVGLKKKEIRALGEALGLPNWNIPATVCLASRIRYGLELTLERLKTVEEAEEFLEEYRLGDVRVRIHDPATLRLEVGVDALEDVIKNREEIVSFLGQREYSYLTLDLQGYRQGSMNVNIGGPRE